MSNDVGREGRTGREVQDGSEGRGRIDRKFMV